MKWNIFLFALLAPIGFVSAQNYNSEEKLNNQSTGNGAVPTNITTNNANIKAEYNSIMVSDTMEIFQESMKAERKEVQSVQKEKAISSKTSMYRSNTDNYKAVKYQSSHNSWSRSATPVQQQEMDASLDEMNILAPDAFETNLYNYANSNYDSDSAQYILRAAEQNPTDKELRQQLSAYYIVEGQHALADSITQQMFIDGTYCNGLANYAKDLSNSVPASNTIVVHGFDDLLPLNSEKVTLNASYEIVSLDLLQSKDYRKSLETKGYAIPASKIVDTAFLVDFVQMNPDKNIQLSMTLPKEYLARFLPNLYPMGLTFAITPNEELNDFNAQLWESEWDRQLLKNGTKDWGDNLSKNYLPSLFTLKSFYEAHGNEEEVRKINEVIQAISARNNLDSKVKRYTTE